MPWTVHVLYILMHACIGFDHIQLLMICNALTILLYWLNMGLLNFSFSHIYLIFDISITIILVLLTTCTMFIHSILVSYYNAIHAS